MPKRKGPPPSPPHKKPGAPKKPSGERTAKKTPSRKPTREEKKALKESEEKERTAAIEHVTSRLTEIIGLDDYPYPRSSKVWVIDDECGLLVALLIGDRRLGFFVDIIEDWDDAEDGYTYTVYRHLGHPNRYPTDHAATDDDNFDVFLKNDGNVLWIGELDDMDNEVFCNCDFYYPTYKSMAELVINTTDLTQQYKKFSKQQYKKK